MYIEREKAKEELLSWAVCINHPEHLSREDAMQVLDTLPAAEVAPVVRCRDCAYYSTDVVNEKGFLICPASGMEITEDDFCSYGERREA